jgi:opacity protein-like surface antigen
MINTLTGCQIKKTTNPFVIGTAVMAVACSSIALTPATAVAVIRDFSCSAGGFTGTVKIDYTQYSVRRINYKIDKGSNRGGNNAKVYFNELNPFTSSSLNGGVQDGQWRYLAGPYARNSGNTSLLTFEFDKSFAIDPSCEKRITF